MMAKALIRAKADVENGNGYLFVSPEFRELEPITQCDIMKDIMMDAIEQYNISVKNLHKQLGDSIERK